MLLSLSYVILRLLL